MARLVRLECSKCGDEFETSIPSVCPECAKNQPAPEGLSLYAIILEGEYTASYLVFAMSTGYAWSQAHIIFPDKMIEQVIKVEPLIGLAWILKGNQND